MPLVALTAVFEKPQRRAVSSPRAKRDSRNPGRTALIGAPGEGVAYRRVLTQGDFFDLIVFTNIQFSCGRTNRDIGCQLLAQGFNRPMAWRPILLHIFSLPSSSPGNKRKDYPQIQARRGAYLPGSGGDGTDDRPRRVIRTADRPFQSSGVGEKIGVIHVHKRGQRRAMGREVEKRPVVCKRPSSSFTSIRIMVNAGFTALKTASGSSGWRAPAFGLRT